MTARAEIPTGEAALAFAAYAGRFPDLEMLFQRVEAAGFPLGVEGRLRAMVVLSRLSSLGAKSDAAALAEYLVPVLAASADEQQSIRRVIEGWANPRGVSGAETPGAQTAPEAAVPREVSRLERADRSGAVLAAGIFGLGVIAVLALIIFTVISGQSTNPAAAARSVVTYSQPVVSLDIGLDPFWRRVIEDTLSRLGFAAAVLIVGLSFVAWRGEMKGRLIRQTDETDFIKPFRLSAEMPKWFRSAPARAAFDRLKRVRLFDTHIIDVQRTVARSTRSGGLPLVVTKRRRELPNYVLLVDRAGRDDLAGIFARTMEAALTEARIVYNRYDFSGGLDRLNPVRGGAGADIVDPEYLPFSVIASRHAGERLILIGTGKGFFELPGFRYDDEEHGTLVRSGTPLNDTIHVREFGAAALITPTPVSAWGENEQRLHELGFALFSADVDGVQNLATQLMAEPGLESTPPPRSPTDEDRFLARLDRDATRLSAAVPPPSAEIERLTRNLRIWAGSSDVYTLLAAIAAFPKIDSAFTFVLAQMVLGREMDSALLARLIRLPWIRNGYMPDWLRIAVVNGLNPEQRRSVQAILMTMLRAAEQAETESPVSLLDQLVADFQVARELPRGRLDALISRIQPRSILSADERIFFSVLRDYKLDPELDVIRPEAPEIIAEMIDAPERARRAQIRLAVIALAAIAALLQPWISAGLTIAGHAVITALQALGIPFSGIPAVSAFATASRGCDVVCLGLAMTMWLVNMNRDDPIVFRHYFVRPPRPLARMLWDPRVWAFFAPSWTLAAFSLNGDRPAADPAFITDVILLTTGLVIFAWVSSVTPEHWWNAQSADRMLEMQVRRDPLTGTLGSLLVAAIWAVPWLIIVIPSSTNNTIGGLFFAACIGAGTWVASSALARRWLIGEPSTGPLYRLWLDAGFALIGFLVFASLIRPVMAADNYSPLLAATIWIAAPAVYSLQLKATLGLRNTQPVWGPLINGTVTGVTVSIAGAVVITLMIRFTNTYNTSLSVISIPVLVGGIAYGAVAVFQFRRSDYPGSASQGLRRKCAILGGVFFLVAAALGFAFYTLPWYQLVENAMVLRTPGYANVLSWFVLPASLAVWPMFRVLASTFRAVDATVPRWRTIADSPWWGTLAMWLAGIVWHFGGIIFSVWPLALPVAVFLWWRYNTRALVPVAVGTLPLLVRLGDINTSLYTTSLYTPGGLWPAIAILFLARFTADETLRQRWLRREHLSWPEAFLIVALLMAHLEISLGTGIAASIHIDPSWMVVAAAFVIGASRMPVWRFAVALIVAWLMPDIPFILNGHEPRPATFIGLLPGDVVTLLLVLYGARAWRTYAASGVGSQYINRFTGFLDRRVLQMKMHGLFLSAGAALTVGILASGWIPAVDLLRIDRETARLDWTFVPSTAGTFALVMLTGLIAGNLWTDRFATSMRFIDQLFHSIFRFAYAPLAVVAIYISVAQTFGAAALAKLGIGGSSADILPRDTGAIGFAVCVIAYLTFGIGTRIVAERRDGENWRATTRRLWTAPEYY